MAPIASPIHRPVQHGHHRPIAAPIRVDTPSIAIHDRQLLASVVPVILDFRARWKTADARTVRIA